MVLLEDQARVPAGSSHGGEFAGKQGGGAASPALTSAAQTWVGHEDYDSMIPNRIIDSHAGIRAALRDDKPGELHDAGDTLIKAAAASPPTQTTLYRGIEAGPREFQRWNNREAGQEVDLNLTSFSMSHEVAKDYAGLQTRGPFDPLPLGKSVILELQPGAHALRIDSVPGISNPGKWEIESLAAGTFRINGKSLDSPTVLRVSITQIRPARSANDVILSESIEEAAGQPRVPKGNPHGGEFAGKQGGGGAHGSILASSKPEPDALRASQHVATATRTNAQLGTSSQPWKTTQSQQVAAKHDGAHAVGDRLGKDPAYQKALGTEGGKFMQGEMEGYAEGVNGYSGGTQRHPHDPAIQYADGAQKLWADTASDNNDLAIEMQYSANTEFGVGSTGHLPLRQVYRSDAGTIEGDRRMASEVQDMGRAYHRARYADTQAHLASLGLQPTDRVTLYRGTDRRSGSERIEGPELDRFGTSANTQTVALAPLSSWSNNFVTATGFGNTVMAASFPVSRIYSVSTRGHGALIEGEVIVLGTGDRQLDMVAFT